MALQRSTATDKNIVDRTKAHRNSDVARAVRRTRDRRAPRQQRLQGWLGGVAAVRWRARETRATVHVHPALGRDF